jgi:hypothetical protein
VADQTIQDRYVQLLLEHVKQEQFPSPVWMDMLEAAMRRPEQLAEYLEALMEKVESTRFPSLSMLQRIHRITSMLPA